MPNFSFYDNMNTYKVSTITIMPISEKKTEHQKT